MKLIYFFGAILVVEAIIFSLQSSNPTAPLPVKTEEQLCADEGIALCIAQPPAAKAGEKWIKDCPDKKGAIYERADGSRYHAYRLCY